MDKCPKCGEKMIEVDVGIFKPNCECMPKDLRLLRLSKKGAEY